MINKILEPRWTRPALIKKRDTLSVSVRGDRISASPRFSLVGERGAVPLSEPVDVQTICGRSYSTLLLDIPNTVSAGLYDLKISVDEFSSVEPHCVWIVQDEPATFNFAHISDLHLMSTGGSVPVDRSRKIEKLMAYLDNVVKPDFIINTGDVISRYGPGKKLYSPANTVWQIEQSRALLLSARIPHYISPGNHDTAFAYIREAWEKHMGVPLNGGTADYAFDYGGLRFLGIERSMTYNDNHEPCESKMTDGQKNWLSRCLAKSDDRDIVLFCHYDYTNELAPYICDNRIIAVLYGHSDAVWIPEALREKDRLLESVNACRVYNVVDGQIDSFSTRTKSELA